MTNVEGAFGMIATRGLGGRGERAFAIPSWTDAIGVKKNFITMGDDRPE